MEFSLMERHKSAKNVRAPKFAYESRFIFYKSQREKQNDVKDNWAIG